MNIETLFVGLLVATLFIELTGIYPGGIIVPGYLALYLDQPWRMAGTIMVSILTLLSYQLLARFLILYGRRRFVMMLFLGGFWTLVLSSLIHRFLPIASELRAIGWIIPGLIANTLQRQRIVITAAAMITTSVLTYFLVKALALL